jgi:hypothetical protein
VTYSVKVAIDGSPIQRVSLDFWDEVAGQKRYRGIAQRPDGSHSLLFDLDEWEGLYSLRVLNAFDTDKAGHCALWCELHGQEPFDVPAFRYLCGIRRTWGTLPRCCETQTMFGLERAEVDWPIESIAPLGLGQLLTPGYLQSGARPMLSVDHVNWVHDRPTRRRYSDAAIHLPLHAVEFAEPFAPIAKDGFAMGFNNFSAAGAKMAAIGGTKVNFSHVSSLTMWDALTCPSRYAIDETVAWGNAAVMQEFWTQGEVRKQARALVAAIHGWCWSGSPFLESKIKERLAAWESRADDLFSIPGGRKQASADSNAGKANPRVESWYVPLWEFAYLAYAVDYAIRVGLIDRSEYLRKLLAFFGALAPLCPYWLYLSGKVRAEEDMAFIVDNNAGVREAEAYVIGWLMNRHGMTSPWNLSALMDDPSTYPPSQHIGFHLAEPEPRPTSQPGVTY